MKGLLVVFVFAALFLPLQVSSPFVKTVQAAPNCETPYLVSPGETLGSIAQRCGLTLGSILRLNPSIRNPDRVLVGQRLVLARDSAGSESSDEPAQAQSEIPVTGSEISYIVKPGDTLGRIAAQVGLSINQIMWANAFILDPNRIYPGQKLRIPAAGSMPRELDWRADRIGSAVENLEGRGVGYQPKKDNERWIHVDLASQTVHAYEGNTIVRSFIVSTGKNRTPTVTGTYPIWIKLRFDDMRGPGYHLKDVPYVMYFYRGYGLHGTYWHNNFGTPMSAGCVNLNTADAAWLYDFASVGTIVNVE
jgi:LysM repeat protein